MGRVLKKNRRLLVEFDRSSESNGHDQVTTEISLVPQTTWAEPSKSHGSTSKKEKIDQKGENNDDEGGDLASEEQN